MHVMLASWSSASSPFASLANDSSFGAKCLFVFSYIDSTFIIAWPDRSSFSRKILNCASCRWHSFWSHRGMYSMSFGIGWGNSSSLSGCIRQTVNGVTSDSRPGSFASHLYCSSLLRVAKNGAFFGKSIILFFPSVTKLLPDTATRDSRVCGCVVFWCQFNADSLTSASQATRPICSANGVVLSRFSFLRIIDFTTAYSLTFGHQLLELLVDCCRLLRMHLLRWECALYSSKQARFFYSASFDSFSSSGIL